MKSFNNIWFTLIELVVSVFISSILLMGIFYFLSENIEEIFLSNNKTSFYNDLNNFREKSLYISNNYNSWVIFVNNNYWSWSDILLLTSKIKDDWYILWVVNREIMKLETWTILYNTYYNKVLWYTKVSSWEIANIYSSGWYIYNIAFNNDNLYNNLKIRDFQLDLYNSWSIINMDISFLLNYNNSLNNSNWIDLSWLELFKINLNF